ncbi:mannose-1-phosphate guanylyltransferase/mannose-6-phosphate isomerase [Neptunomonas phycophila]|uniref:mannose-1-phosphate guanylyltransferase/mannose-6-phosphate isomerase n=1 Tax=Neptunomonas phycophila TaxID=1572645 RepID=UPI001BE9B423|nr:mannose-1-phosphate guanylyltransferase/mannose-6-phosphate isomerase [Neptunomonas phycophila]MBT3144130.1 mannose-1-phosphate guanylyltransferase/mannose-6-phosphate isomerase [Neptunomonas phycophila]
MLPIILSGGSGTRLWPMSRSSFPKQFLSLNSNQTMLQETVLRLGNVEEVAVICNEDHRFLVAEQMRSIHQKCSILLEPVGRNTAPAIAIAAIEAAKAGKENEALLVLSSDHVIKDTDAFKKAISAAEPLVAEGNLVTFGIVPNKPEVGYGYIKAGSSVGEYGFAVAEFVEKPNAETAQEYLDSGSYYWNSGMFMFTAKRYLEELKAYRPDILAACEAAMAETQSDLDFVRVDKDAFTNCPDESVDYAVMEKTDKAVVIPLDAGWSDVGSWSALWEIKDKDINGNVFEGDVIAHSTNNSMVVSNERLVATLGVDDLIIVDTKDALMVAHKDAIQDVKQLVNSIKDAGREEHKVHREVYRPWGKYDSIDNGARYQVKRITVKPGEKLSVQMHHHRAEHWIVVSGTASVTCGENTFLLSENQSTYIPLGEVHCLENPGKVELELIEVQSGSYLGEDDIVRFVDQYGRA